MPVMPQKLAGWRIEPPVSVPVAAGSRRAATAAAEPPDEPPGTRAASHGLRTGAEGRVLVARAHRELVAVELAERHRAGLARGGRRRWRRTGCGSRRASASRRWSAGRAVTKMSLWAIGTPSSGAARRRRRGGASAARGLRQRALRRRRARNAPSRSWPARRSSRCRVTSTLDSLAARAAPRPSCGARRSSCSAMRRSFDHLRHEEQAVARPPARCAGSRSRSSAR